MPRYFGYTQKILHRFNLISVQRYSLKPSCNIQITPEFQTSVWNFTIGEIFSSLISRVAKALMIWAHIFFVKFWVSNPDYRKKYLNTPNPMRKVTYNRAMFFQYSELLFL